MPSRGKEILKSLVAKEYLLPYFKNAILSENWPSQYQVTIDSRPYYGLGDGYFHPSSHGLMGARKLYYLFHPRHRARLVHEPHDVQTEMTFAMGSALHGVVQTQFEMSGVLRPENIEVEYIIDEHHVRGRTDMVIDHPIEGEIVTELKTQNSRMFNFQKEMKDTWCSQLSMALYGLKKQWGVLMVLESGFPYRMREYRHERDDTLLEQIFAKFAYVREAIEADTPPPHCCAQGSPEMKKCPARFECWLKRELKT
jgi:hypothetical protein